jgi:hypothetical protein
MHNQKTFSRRRFLGTITLAFTGTGVLAACAPASREPNMRFVYPEPGARVPMGDVAVQVRVRNFNLVRGNTSPRAREGHLHFFINTPADEIADGQVIPLDQPDKFVHAGAPPFNTRTISLPPGVHTLTAVMGDSAHLKLAEPAPVSVTFFVQPAPAPPTSQ